MTALWPIFARAWHGRALRGAEPKRETCKDPDQSGVTCARSSSVGRFFGPIAPTVESAVRLGQIVKGEITAGRETRVQVRSRKRRGSAEGSNKEGCAPRLLQSSSLKTTVKCRSLPRRVSLSLGIFHKTAEHEQRDCRGQFGVPARAIKRPHNLFKSLLPPQTNHLHSIPKSILETGARLVTADDD